MLQWQGRNVGTGEKREVTAWVREKRRFVGRGDSAFFGWSSRSTCALLLPRDEQQFTVPVQSIFARKRWSYSCFAGSKEVAKWLTIQPSSPWLWRPTPLSNVRTPGLLTRASFYFSLSRWFFFLLSPTMCREPPEGADIWWAG